jgi:hypothetical protein
MLLGYMLAVRMRLLDHDQAALASSVTSAAWRLHEVVKAGLMHRVGWLLRRH